MKRRPPRSTRTHTLFPYTTLCRSPLLATARAGNVFGGGDWAVDRLVPDIVRAIMAGTPVDIRNPGSVRPWQHVLEPLSGYLTLAARLLGDNRSEERRVGKEGVSTGRSRWAQYLIQKNKKQQIK